MVSDEVRAAQWKYLQQVTSKIGVAPFDILDNFTTCRLPNDLTSVVFYAFRTQIRPEWMTQYHPVKALELALRLVDLVEYAKVECPANFVRFRFETHVRLPLDVATPALIK